MFLDFVGFPLELRSLQTEVKSMLNCFQDKVDDKFNQKYNKTVENYNFRKSNYKIKLTLLGFLSLALIFGSLFVFKKSPSAASTSHYESLKISPSSLNGNTIWGDSESFDTVVAAGGLDAWAAFYSATNKSSGGLDPSGYLSVNGVPYNFTWTGSAPFDGNDAIRLVSSYTSSTISLDTIGAYEKLYVLGTAGGPGEGNYANFAVRVNYTDGTTDETTYRLYDWYDSTPVSGVYKYPGLARRLVVKSGTSSGSSRPGSNNSSNNGYNYEGTDSAAPYLQSATISVNPKKLVSSVDLVMTGKNGSSNTEGIYCGIYAVTGMVNVSAPSPVENIFVDNVSETTADISWNSVPNATSYRLDIALDPDFKNILPSYNNLLIHDIFLTATGLTGDTTYYTRVRAENNEGQSISSNVAPFTTDHETTPPVLVITANPNLIQISDTINLSATDASGVQDIQESTDSGATWNIISTTDSATQEITENGTYCFRASDVYNNTSEPECLTYSNLDTAKPVISVDANGYTPGTWTNQPVTLTVNSLTSNVGTTSYYYSVDNGQTWQPYASSVVFNGETSETGQVFSFKAVSEAGVESDVVSVLVKKDSTAPTGEISGEEQEYNSFLNTITFGLFFNRTVEFSLTPEDALSGVASVEYLITKTNYASEADALAASGWQTVSGPVAIQPEKDFILYYKITDAAGNVAVLNTDGIVLDTTDALIVGYVSPGNTYVLEDGQTYYLTQKILVTDNKALDSVKINGEPVALSNLNIIELSGNATNTYEIVAQDKAGNTTTYTIHTSPLSDLALNITEDNYKTSDKETLEQAISVLQDLEQTQGQNATAEEREIISSLIQEYETIISEIDALEEEIAAEHAVASQIPSTDIITSDNRSDAEEVLTDIKDTLAEDSTHLTISEQNDLLQDETSLEEKVQRLDEVAEQQADLAIVYQTDTEVIKTSDKTELLDLLAEANGLLAGQNETVPERQTTEEEKQIILDLLTRIEEAETAEHTNNIDSAEQLLPENYTRADKDLLEDAKTDIISAISDYGGNYTTAESERLDNLLDQINAALQDIADQEEAEIRANTFPTLTLTGDTENWKAADDLQIAAGDAYGVAQVEISADNGLTWTELGATTSATATITENGTYLVRVTNLFDNQTEQSITYANIDGVAPALQLNSHGYTLGSWTNSPVTLSAVNVAPNLSPVVLYYRVNNTDLPASAVATLPGSADQTPDADGWLPYSADAPLTHLADTSGTTYEFYAVSAAGLVSDVIQGEVKKDSVAPTGSATLGENSWNSLLNTVTFGLFFNDTAEFTISASDDRSGLSSAEYLISNSELSPETLASLPQTQDPADPSSPAWSPLSGSTVSVDPERDFILYFRVQDTAGNIAYINSDGVILDVTPPTVLGYANGETYALESDKIYYLTQKLLVTDNKGIKQITLNGTEITPNQNSLADLPGNHDAENILVVTDQAGNITTLTLKTGKIKELTDLEHKNVNDSEEIEQEIQDLYNLASDRPSESEQELIQHLLEDYQNTLDEILQTEEKVFHTESEADRLPDVSHVTEEHAEQIAELLEATEDILANNFNHLTVQEVTDLEELKDELQEKLKAIQDFQTAKTNLENEVGNYNPNTVTSDDKPALEELKQTAEELKGSTNASAEDQTELQDLINQINSLITRINEAEQALQDAQTADTVPDVTPANVTPEDQTALEDAATAYAEALGVFDSNLSPTELLGATNRIAIIGSALDVLDQVAEFEALINQLPNPEDVSFATRSAIHAAQAAYEALSEYARTLVGPSLLSKYRAVLEAYRAYLAGSPILYAFETLDVFWWGLTSFFIAATFFFIASRTHRRYSEVNSDRF